jgi:hypothetical protein
MRVPITVQVESFEIESVQPAIDAVRQSLGHYLEGVPRKSSRSKHGLMGPVGKILNEVKSGRRDPASLKGYAIRVHEAGGRAPSSESLEALATGIDGLVALMATVPATAHDRVLDRLDYGLYFDLRKRALESKEVRRQAWLKFLGDKYLDELKLSQAWGEQIDTFDDLYLPRKAEGSKKKKATARQQDIAAFWESQGIWTVASDEEEE